MFCHEPWLTWSPDRLIGGVPASRQSEKANLPGTIRMSFDFLPSFLLVPYS